MFIDLLQEACGDDKVSVSHHRFCCPFCGEDDYKFYVEVDEPHRYICFKCDLRGNPVRFVREYYGVNYHEAVDILKGYDYDIENMDVSRFNSKYADDTLTEGESILLAINGVLTKEREGYKEDEIEDIPKVLPTLPTNIKFLINEVQNPEALPFLKYLESRGVTPKDILNHGIGYVTAGTVQMPNGTFLTLSNHVVFLTYDLLGNPVYWNTRAIHRDSYIKSFNAPSRPEEYGKADTIFNLNRARMTDKVIINEGVFDALTCGDSGVATFGKQITDTQIKLLQSVSRTNPKVSYYVFLDRDAHDKGDKLAERLYEVSKNVFLVANDTDHDANDLGVEKVKELIDNALPFNDVNRIKYMMLKKSH